MLALWIRNQLKRQHWSTPVRDFLGRTSSKRKDPPWCKWYLPSSPDKGRWKRNWVVWLPAFTPAGKFTHPVANTAALLFRFPCRLKTRSSPDIFQAFSSKQGLLRHPTTWSELLPYSPVCCASAIVRPLGLCPTSWSKETPLNTHSFYGFCPFKEPWLI